MHTITNKITENREKDPEENYGPKKTTQEGYRLKPRNRNKNQKTKILWAHGKNGSRETKQESL